MKCGQASIRDLMFPEVPHAISAVESPLFPTGEIVEPKKQCTALVPWVQPAEVFNPLHFVAEYFVRQMAGWIQLWVSNHQRAMSSLCGGAMVFPPLNHPHRHHE